MFCEKKEEGGSRREITECEKEGEGKWEKKGLAFLKCCEGQITNNKTESEGKGEGEKIREGKCVECEQSERKSELSTPGAPHHTTRFDWNSFMDFLFSFFSFFSPT